ncbi:MAG: DUF5658 family protein [Fimbriimonadales bacterium]
MRRLLPQLSAESWAILLVCVADLLITLVMIDKGLADEGNPLMKFYLGHGVWAFILAKSVLVLAPIVVIEWARQHKPRTVRAMARVGLMSYLGIYAFLFLTINVSGMAHGNALGYDPAEYPPIDWEAIQREREGLPYQELSQISEADIR